MRVAECGGGKRPWGGDSDWGCWDCAAASRTGSPNGLAVKQPHAPSTKIQTHTKKTRTRSDGPGQRDAGKMTTQEEEEEETTKTENEKGKK